jgi:hypothetical protein
MGHSAGLGTVAGAGVYVQARARPTHPLALNAYLFFSTKINMLPEFTNNKAVAGMWNVSHKSSRDRGGYLAATQTCRLFEKRCEI